MAKTYGTQRTAAIEHPGVGELGRAKSYHVYDATNEIPEGAKITFALVGNQNCGKTTLFNQLTGANQHVGNFPGVTVDRKDGTIRKHSNEGIEELIDHAIHVARHRESPGRGDFCPVSSDEHDSVGAVHRFIHVTVHILDPKAKEKSLTYLNIWFLFWKQKRDLTGKLHLQI